MPGFLENFENAWDPEFQLDIDINKEPQTESAPMKVTDNMGREIFWEDIGRPEYPNLATKIFSETCCAGCGCKNE